MTHTIIPMSEADFDRTYPLLPNHINPSTGWDIEGVGCCLFETHGPEFDFVRRQDPRTIWTLIEGDDGELCLISGLHVVNRVGYLISKVATPPLATIEVRIGLDADSEEAIGGCQ